MAGAADPALAFPASSEAQRGIREVTATFPAWDDWSCQTLQTGAILTV